MRTYRLLSIALGLLLPLMGCSTSVPAPSSTAAPAPAAGKSTIMGQITSNTNGAPIKQTIVQLARVYYGQNSTEAVFALDLANSPGTFTDEQGAFMFTSILPGEYVISVGDYYGQNDIVREENGDARVFKAEPDKTLNIGVAQVKPNLSPGR